MIIKRKTTRHELKRFHNYEMSVFELIKSSLSLDYKDAIWVGRDDDMFQIEINSGLSLCITEKICLITSTSVL